MCKVVLDELDVANLEKDDDKVTHDLEADDDFEAELPEAARGSHDPPPPHACEKATVRESLT